MDKVLWIVIAAAVAIALAGVVMFIAVGGDSSVSEMIGEADDTRDSQTCSFIEDEVDAGRMSCDNPDVEDCDIDACS